MLNTKTTVPSTGGLNNKGFTYVPAVCTDIRQTFERVRLAQLGATPLKHPTGTGTGGIR